MERMFRGVGVVGFALLASACGGRVDPDLCPPGEHCTAPDTGVDADDTFAPDTGYPILDTGYPPPPDSSYPETWVTPDGGSCGSGYCSAGYTCAISCGSCTCLGGSSWSCSASTDCYETGIPDVPTACPVIEPFDGQSCFDEGSYCNWPSACGTTDYGYCSAGRWAMKADICPSGCPPYRPAAGTTCVTTSPYPYCKYTSSCGGTDLAYCTSGRWTYGPSDCPPPPPCPPVLPADSSYCPVDRQECEYKNACGTIDRAVCNLGRWSSTGTCTGGSCPVYEPVSGTYCSTPSSTMCSYTEPFGCGSSCFCARDFRWACYDLPCIPPSFDGGVPEAGSFDTFRSE